MTVKKTKSAETNNEDILYGIITKYYTRFDVINAYAKDIQEKIQELIDELIKDCNPEAVICHCSVLNTFAQDIISQTESAVNDIPR